MKSLDRQQTTGLPWRMNGWTGLAAFLLLLATATAQLTYPPTLPEGKSVATHKTPEFLKPGANLREGVEIAKTAPEVDFLFYQGQTLPGSPWSVWGDGSAVNGKYYSAIGDHKGPRGRAQIYEYDPATKKLRMLVDLKDFLEQPGMLPEGMDYTPGKIHSRIQMGSDGWLYYSSHRGTGRTTTDKYGFKGDWIFRTHPKTAKTEIVAAQPVLKHCMPASTLDAERLIFYAGTAAGADAAEKDIKFLAYDIKNRKTLQLTTGGFDRYVIIGKTGKLFWRPRPKRVPRGEKPNPWPPGRSYDPATNTFGESNAPHVRSATTETADGWVYGTSGRECQLWGFNTRTGQLVELGEGAVSKATYTTTIEVDPTGRYLYYVPGGHGGGERDGTPIVQYDLKRKKRKVIAFLHDFFYNNYNYSMCGSFGTALDAKGETLFVTWNGKRKGARKWDACAMVAIHIPASER